jgi:helicase
MGDGGCLDETQLIYTEDGLKSIKEVTEGEFVLAHDGILHKVIRLYNREYTGDLIGIKCKGTLPIEITPNHEIFVADSGVGKHKNVTEASSIYSKKASDLTTKNYMCFPLIQDIKQIEIPDYATNDYIELAGHYLSNGSLSYSNRSFCRLGICYGTHKKNDIERCVELLSKLSNNKISTRTKHENNTATDITTHDVVLVKKLLHDFDKGALNKKIPGWILYGDTEDIELILKGLFRGDGCFSGKGYWFTTISKNLCYSVNFILKRIGIFSTIRKQRQLGKGHHDVYQVMVHNSTFFDKIKLITAIL